MISELDSIQKFYNRFIGGLCSSLSVFEELQIDSQYLDSVISKYESRGYSFVRYSNQDAVKTPSRWHFTKQGMRNVINSKLKIGDKFQLEAFRAYEYLRLKKWQYIFEDDRLSNL